MTESTITDNGGGKGGPSISSARQVVPEYIAGIRMPQVKETWWRAISMKVVLGLLVPIFLTAVYWGLWATDRYMSETTLIIKDAGSSKGEVEGLSLIGTISPSQRDALLVKEYILSWDMLSYLESELRLQQHYSSSDVDFISRLSKNATREEFLDYYQNYVAIEYIEMSSHLNIQVQAFDKEMSRRIVEQMLEKSELFINEIGNKLAEEQMSFVNTELERAKSTLKEAKLSLIAFQQEHNTFSPEQQSESMMQLISSLETEIARSEAESKKLNSYLNDDAPQMVALRTKIEALQSQLDIEKKRMVGEGDENISKVHADYQDLLMSIEFATDTYRTALVSLEQARVEAYQKLKHLVVVDPPVSPDSAEYPRRMYSFMTSTIFILILYGLAIMIFATVKEHRNA